MKCDPSLLRPAQPAVKSRLIRQLLLPPLVILLMVGLGFAGFMISENNGIRTLSENGERALELHARTVESEISKYTYLPSLLELEDSVSLLLTDPDGGNRQAVNEYLEGLNWRSRSRAIFVLDTNGRVQATSNWRDADSFLGKTWLFVPTSRTPCAASLGASTASAAPPVKPATTWPTGLKNTARSSVWR